MATTNQTFTATDQATAIVGASGFQPLTSITVTANGTGRVFVEAISSNGAVGFIIPQSRVPELIANLQTAHTQG